MSEEKPIHQVLAEMQKAVDHDPVIESCRGLLKEVNSQKFVINEDVFVRDLLPMLAGEEGVNGEVDLNFWRHNVGSWMRPIHVCDASGQELFVVPPIFNRNAVIAKKQVDDSDSLDTDLAVYQRKSDIDQGRGAQFLLDAMRDRFENRVDYVAEGKQINEILARYNKPLLKLSEEAEATGRIKPEGKLNVSSRTTNSSTTSVGQLSNYHPEAFDEGGLD